MKEDNKQIKTVYKFEVANSILGKGCFATEPIKKGEFICFFEGKEVSWKEQERRYLEGKDRLDDPFQISKTKYIELDKPYIYFNHSCNPNSGFRGKNELIAIKNIIPDEEIVYDYSTVTWDDRWVKKHGPWTMNCGCKGKNCRKVIGDFLTIPESQKRKYIMLGIVPDFILRRLNENKKKY
jgi:SET domain-containing protein